MLRYLAPLLCVMACANPSQGVAIDRVVPDRAEIQMSQPVMIEGTFHVLTSNLDQGDTTAALVTAAVDAMPLAGVTWMTESQISATMPGLAEGVYDVTVSLDGRNATLENGYIVGNPPLDGGTDGGGSFTATHRININGPVTAGPHTDFPLLVDLQNDLLRTTANGGEVANAQGFDIFFSLDQAGTTRLSHELERYVDINGELVAWVKVPSMEAGNVFFIHVGNPSVTTSLENVADVWSSSYAAVWHLTDASDSAGNNPGAETNTTSDPDGQIELAKGFDGSSSSIAIASSASVDNIFDGGGTIEAWFFAQTPGENNLGRVFEKSIAGGYVLAMCDANAGPNSVLFGQAFSGTTINWCTNANVITPSTWCHVVVVYDSSSAANRPLIFINGASVQVNGGQPTGSRVSDAGDPLVIGDREIGSRAFSGSIDEARLARTTRTAGWIQTTFANHSDPRNFITLVP